MAIPLSIHALSEALAKSGRMDAANRQRLSRRLERAGATTPQAIRAYIANGGTQPSVARLLTKLMPTAEEDSIFGYRTLARLAEGGMGTIWLVDGGDGLAVLKTLRTDLVDDDDYSRRFAREVTITSQLQHPNVVRCISHGHSEAGCWLLLDYIPGGDAHTLVTRMGSVGEVEALVIVHQAMKGLSYAWQRGVVHRDLKPANLLIDHDGQVHVADFGLALIPHLAGDSALTATGTALGSPPYMAPEQIRAEAVDWRSDLYAMGCVLTHLITGRPPFTGSMAEICAGHLSAIPRPLDHVQRDVCRLTTAFAERCLAKRPERRYSTPEEANEALVLALMAKQTDVLTTLSAETIDGSTTAVEPGADEVEPPSSQAFPSPNPESGPPAARPHAQTAIGTPARPRFDGDWADTVTGPRLTISLASGSLIALLAQDELLLGKQLAPPVDLPLRLYPAAEHATSCDLVSRQHLRIAADRTGAWLSDAGSANGTMVDGHRLIHGEQCRLEFGRGYAVDIASVLQLQVRAYPRRTQPISDLPGAPDAAEVALCGLACDGPVDAVVVRRTANRPDVVVAQVPRRILIGPDFADVVVSGWRLPEAIECTCWNGRWIARRGQGNWLPPCLALEGLGECWPGGIGDLVRP